MLSGDVAPPRLKDSQAKIFPTSSRQRRFLSSLITMNSELFTMFVIVLVPFVLLAGINTVLEHQLGPRETRFGAITALLAIPAPVIIAILAVRGHYSRPVTLSTALAQMYIFSSYAALIGAIGLMQIGTPLFYYCFPALWLIAPPVVLAARCLANTFLRNVGLEQCRILGVGTAHGLKQIDLAVESDPIRGYRVVATFNLQAMASLTRLTENHLLDGIHNALRAAKADFILLSLWDCDDWFRNAVIAGLIREVIPFGLIPDFGDVPIYRCSVNHHMSRAPIMLIINDRIPYTFARVTKEVLDRTIALVAVVALLPVFLSVAVAVACDGGPVLYRQTRIGQNGRRFQCLKFRSMSVGADARLAALLAENEAAAAEWERHQKLRYDPRVTPVGRFIRKTSLDELPQLFNVLKGEMSLVGLRPVLDAEVARYGPDQDLYCRFKPGITGLWQISGRSDTSYHRRVELDTWYVKNWTLSHDISILLRTIPALLQGTGAV